MSFYRKLVDETKDDRRSLESVPIIRRCLQGDIVLDEYVAFLCQAYHHVRHTVPLLMAVGARLPEDKEWLREAVGEYIEEEMGHQEWILNDIAHCGYDRKAARNRPPHVSTELMVAYAWDMVSRVDPLGFFGMVHVLEGTSIALAEKAADAISGALSLPREAFSYLYSHGSLDHSHIRFFSSLMDRISEESEQRLILHASRTFYLLYGNIFRALSPDHGLPAGT